LAGVREDRLNGESAANHQGYFWEKADRVLNSLNLDPEARAKIETSLLKVVKRPTAAEKAKADKRIRRLRTNLRNL